MSLFCVEFSDFSFKFLYYSQTPYFSSYLRRTKFSVIKVAVILLLIMVSKHLLWSYRVTKKIWCLTKKLQNLKNFDNFGATIWLVAHTPTLFQRKSTKNINFCFLRTTALYAVISRTNSLQDSLKWYLLKPWFPSPITGIEKKRKHIERVDFFFDGNYFVYKFQ